MGAPVDTGIENFEEVILGLSPSDRAKLIGWISETLVEEEDQNYEEDRSANEKPASAEEAKVPKNLGAIRPPKACSPTERSQQLDRLNGSWSGSDSAEKLIEVIYSSRTTNDREYLHHD